jgi:hypothetical protein
MDSFLIMENIKVNLEPKKQQYGKVFISFQLSARASKFSAVAQEEK